MERNNIFTSYDEDSDPASDPRIASTDFFGTLIQTTVTSRPEIIHQWIYHHWPVYGEQYENRLIVGVGVQWRASNQRRAHTLQLCIDTHCLLIQLSHTPRIPQVLDWFLGDGNIHFVGIRNDSDYPRLLNNEHVLLVPNLINLSDYFHHSESSISDLASSVLGIEGVRRDTLAERSDWSARDLTIDQLQYAVVDAYVSLQVGRAINIWQVHNYWGMDNIKSSYDEDSDPAPDARIAFTYFFGRLIETTVTSRPETIHNWIYYHWDFYGGHLGNRLTVGVSVQWRPSSDNHGADTLSLCIDSRCLLIKLSHTPLIPIILRWFLGDRYIHFVGIENRFAGQRLLNNNEHRLFVPNLINMSDIIDLVPHFESTRQNLARFVLGIGDLRRDGPAMSSNWRAEHLTVDQVQYAVVDAYVSYQVGMMMNIWQFPNCWSLGFVGDL